MNTARSLRIGITIGLRDAAESLWVNGIKQNALYLMKLFQHSPLRHRVTLVNTTAVEITPSLPWDLEQFPVRSFDDAKDSLDVLIELGGQIDPLQTRYLQSRGAKVVSYCCGPEYVQMTEAMIFSRRLADSIFINQEYDQVWVIPQVVETSAGFFSVLRRRPVREVPFVWDPMCLDMRTRDLPFSGEYRPTARARRLSIMEPNIDVLKFCLYPLLIAESAYRQCGPKIDYVHVTNADHFARMSPEFIGVARHLDLVRDSKVSFVGRYDTPQFLVEHTDIVVSNQWGLALNYFYFDVCWNGYALVHNAHLCKELGYYYPNNDVDEGARRVVEAVECHSETWQRYLKQQRKLIGRFLATNPDQVEAYDRLLIGLFDDASPST
ncbi:hypothetical protein WI80_14260 [Burkholderia ubonensis]|uniref:DUF2827 domain-containing protein n=1 Tax=Burkholderia TaxID=32008 RepID=UPI0005AC0215|nr:MULTISPECIES: DUF2827 domain-containing protein [Burkholderia]KIP17226.1 hypothetical protein KY49_7011 [Burkholderia sp. MSHR3999]KVD09051.1 hypothetical protein WI80_14260 [Burkholderia ubonensis]KVU24403.1 hypothetical protein WK63_26825 [Burkholderia ubonensis]